MKVLVLANNDVGLYKFRKELLNELISPGSVIRERKSEPCDVYISLPWGECIPELVQMGCKFIDTDIDRRGVNPKNDVKLIKQYKKIISDVKPDIIFSYTIKPNIYGSIVSRRLKCRQVCNVTGTGATFLKKSLISTIATLLYKLSIKKCYKVFFQNSGDKDYFVEHKMVKDNWDMLPGSGCNLSEHTYVQMPSDDVVQFIFIGRVMMLKGIDEYLACAKAIKQKYPNTRFLIAGWNEEEKYKAIVDEYEKDGYVEYIGFRKDINDWIAGSHCTILPSRGGEGVPNVLLESAATGRVCIGSEINGTTDVIEDGKTGYLFKTGDWTSLTEKVEAFLKLSYDEKVEMGKAGRTKIENEFNRNIVINKYLCEVDQCIKSKQQ